MKREELEIGHRYEGPGGRCYEIVDLVPGWRIGSHGEWAEDLSMRTRHMPGRGEMSYRSCLAVKAYLVGDDGEMTKAVIDPRKLLSSWVEFEAMRDIQEQSKVHAGRLVALLRRNLRGAYPGYRPAEKESYSVSSDGKAVTLPVQDLSALLDVAFGGASS